MRRVLALLALILCATASAQQAERPNGVFLIAKPGLIDPNFRQTVVLATQTPDFHTVGVIINRPTTLKLSQFYSSELPTVNYKDPIFFGGPVMRQAMVAVFHSDRPPEAPAFHVLKGLYLSLHPANIEALLRGQENRYRLYAGFSGWAPRQLEGELERDGWYLLPADEETVFRKNLDGLWQELLEKAMQPRAETKNPVLGLQCLENASRLAC